ncbi:DNA-binding transcriptional regulator, LysR family [Rhodoblastus acidophilus]|uniref:DNA-binding transcriptional regulator, LysR family n=1 Tax=Rhodoblastus acidophilus TaxID=1074 RepID=A0A212RCL0_RHOAC|nr:LysR family transcriptional regulator [Rhodoblastus acidophilus]MCW2317162.1 DNA-binding transcriptional LysR family regulator [Rhodoblastus acidophilus]PPQ37004.1 LysR family transcriptional regulator [Rhodoblastus acidophilus]RAI18595.1 LysR family transcriptional regulator [Rhodoblastus acidophilus]SNB70015.1 DNA-binding transcriptional regulator, LysR family [Rhodoblastus acidophilus]
MELKNLRAFVEVIRQNGFTAAGKALNATQSTVSKAVRALEDEIGAPLLDRLAQKPRMTAIGEAVYARAVRLLAERDDLLAEIDELRGLKRGALRLGLPPVGSGILFAPLFARFRRAYPGIDIRLVEQGSARLEEILRLGEIDFAASLLPVDEDFEWHEIRRDPLMTLVAAENPLAQRGRVTIQDLRDTPLILFESGFAQNRVIINACHRAGFEPVVAARSGQIDFVVELAAADVGAAFLPRLLVESHARRGVASLALDEPDVDWRLALVWRKGAYLSDAARAWQALAMASRFD